MSKLHKSIIFVILLGNLVSAQETVKIDSDDIVKITSSLIQIDVTVTDKKGNPISDLTAKDFEIYENGVKQNVSGVNFVSSATKQENKSKEAYATKQEVELPPVVRKVTAEDTHRTVAIVVDDLSLEFGSIYFVKNALKKFVAETMVDGDLVAIVRTGGGMGARQQFTVDKRQLNAAIDSLKFNMFANPSESPFINGDPDSAKKIIAQEIDDYREDLFSVGMLGAVNYLVKGMKELPGRKSIVLFSKGFGVIPGKTSRPSRFLQNIENLAEFANRSGIVIYTIDPSGIDAPGGDANSQFSTLTKGFSNDDRKGFLRAGALRILANATGGRAFFDNKSISDGIETAIKDQSYYLLAYEPDEDTFDPVKNRFNSIEIRVARKDAIVRYRTGFFSKTDEALTEKSDEKPLAKILNALVSPFNKTEISIGLTSLYISDEKQKSFIRTLIHVSGDMLDVLRNTGKPYNSNFDLILMLFGENGVPISNISNTYKISIDADKIEAVMKDGFSFQALIPVAKPGAYQLRSVVREVSTNHVGAGNQFIVIPNLKKDRLELSGIELLNLTDSQISAINKGADLSSEFNVISDTSNRVFAKGTTLRASLDIYNLKKKNGVNDAEGFVRLIKDNKIVLETSPAKLNVRTDIPGLAVSLKLGSNLELGNYILQLIVKDMNASPKHATNYQFTDFELIN